MSVEEKVNEWVNTKKRREKYLRIFGYKPEKTGEKHERLNRRG